MQKHTAQKTSDCCHGGAPAATTTSQSSSVSFLQAEACCTIHQAPRTETPVETLKTFVPNPVSLPLAVINHRVHDGAHGFPALLPALASTSVVGHLPIDRQAVLATFLT